MIYSKNGTSYVFNDISKITTEFYIKDLGEDYPNRFLYPGDSLNKELGNELVKLYDKLRNVFFDNIDEYYKSMRFMPIFVQSAGQCSDCGMTAEEFGKCIQDETFCRLPDFNKHLYLADCQFLVRTIQNLLSGMEDIFVNYFISISNLKTTCFMDNPNTTVYEMSQNVSRISSMLESYFIKAYSILDMVIKIMFEIQNPQEDFSKYPRMKSEKMLWGDIKKLTITACEDTLFEKCELVKMIESMRNEVVHNGSWEVNPKVFTRFVEGQSVERYMLFPDISQGRLSKVKGRKHFFSDGTKVNDILPKIHENYQFRLLNTIKFLNNHTTEKPLLSK